MELHVRDHPPMATAGPQVVAESSATMLRAWTTGKQEIPAWHVSRTLLTRPVAEEEMRKEAKEVQETSDAAWDKLPSL